MDRRSSSIVRCCFFVEVVVHYTWEFEIKAMRSKVEKSVYDRVKDDVGVEVKKIERKVDDKVENKLKINLKRKFKAKLKINYLKI